MSNWRDYVENILIAVFLALVVRTFVIAGYKVPTSSMAPYLLPGDFIFSYRLPYGVKIPFVQTKIAVNPPTRGEVVVFTYPEQPRVTYVKRVIGLPGDRIQIIQGRLQINGENFSYKDIEPESFFDKSIDKDLFKSVLEIAPEGSRRLLFERSENSKTGGANFGPLIVPPNEVFLLGDNRDTSDDSRYWGTVPIERIEGRVVFVWLSLDWQNKIWDSRFPSVRWERTWSLLN
jgi:signal peptidase I